MADGRFDVIVIGGGIVGLATARELLHRSPRTSLLLVEKEHELAAHQTGHNSGVIHSGLYYRPGSLKAKLCVTGAARMVEFCRENGVPHEVCGKVVVATDKSELPALEEVLSRGTQNGVPNLRKLTREQIREIEPHANGIAGIHVPGTGITDFAAVSKKYAEHIESAGGTVRTDAGVHGFRRVDSGTVVQTKAGDFRGKLVINCAGLYGDTVARLAGATVEIQSVPFRGEYYDLKPGKAHMVRGLIYPVPDPRFPFLGVHFTKRIYGGADAGPNAVLAFAREGYGKTSFNFGEAVEILRYPGFWVMARKYWKAALGEYYRSFSKAAFVLALQKLMPELVSSDLTPGHAGVRSQALKRDGTLMDDFHFVVTEGIVHVVNVPSPAATASLEVAREIVDRIFSNNAGAVRA
jgi:L-2-hydroxyglutarate oxidase LhgO